MKKWMWLLLFLLTFGAGAFYLVDRSKDKESKRISDETRAEEPVLAPPPPPLPPPAVPGQPALPEPRRGGTAPAPTYQDPAFPANPPDQFNPPPAFDNLPPPAQYDSPPAPYIPPEPDEFGQPGDPPPDPYEGVDPQYVPSEPLDGDIIPPPGDGKEY